ncbi:MAG: RNA-binding cell elongation regulator Jag/EloR [Candidatus Gallimonas sp.]
MAKSEIFTGKTVEEAIETGLEALGAAREDVEIEVLDEGKKRLIGKSSPAEVKLTVKEKLTDGGRAVVFLEGLFALLKEDVKPQLQSEDEKIVIQLEADSSKGLIGRRGEIIDAVQILAGAVANTGRRDYKRVVVDYGNYREQREDTLRHVAEKLAAKAVRLGKRVRLEPMNPYERRIIHSALMNNPDVTTRSEGKEPARYVVITPKNMKPNDRNRNGRYGDKKFDKKYGNKDRGNRYGEKKPYPKRELPKEDTPQSSGTTLKSSGSGSGFRRGGFSGFFGTYLGNSRDEETTPENKDEE